MLAAVSSISATAEGELPRLMLLGTQKAATTSLYSLLTEKAADLKLCGANPPEAFSKKEFHFFDQTFSPHSGTPRFPKHATAQDLAAQYRKGFHKNSSCSHRIDATPRYLYDTQSHVRMGRMPNQWISQLRLLAILREPLSRDLSVYNMAKSEWWVNRALTSVMGIPVEAFACKKSTPSSFPSYAESVGCFVAEWRSRRLEASREVRSTARARSAGHSHLGGHLGPSRSLASSILIASSDASEHEMKESYEDYCTAWSQCGFRTTSDNVTTDNRIANGMYIAQVIAYAKVFKRSQLMFVDFGALVGAQDTYISDIVKFYGLGALAHPKVKLPDENSHHFGGEVTQMECQTKEELSGVFATPNRLLFKWLADSRTSGTAPPEEPQFGTGSDNPDWAAPHCHNYGGRTRET